MSAHFMTFIEVELSGKLSGGAGGYRAGSATLRPAEPPASRRSTQAGSNCVRSLRLDFAAAIAADMSGFDRFSDAMRSAVRSP